MTNKPLVLITGATGHLGFRTLVLALQAGYRARIAIRKASQSTKIASARSVTPYINNISFVEVPDVTAPGAYDHAVQDVDSVIHMASPVIPVDPSSLNGNWEETFYAPAKQGTLGMLQAAAKSPSVRRVVVTSTTMALQAPEGKDRPGPYDIRSAPDMSSAANVDFRQAYGISKLLAHTSATEFVESTDVSFSLIRVLPGLIQGANELVGSKIEVGQGSNMYTMNAALGIVQPYPRVTAQVWLDDVASAHVGALDSRKVQHKQNLLVVGNGGNGVEWDEYAEEIRKQFPKAVEAGLLDPVRGQKSLNFNYDVSSSEDALGFKFAGVDAMVKSVVGQYLDLVGMSPAVNGSKR